MKMLQDLEAIIKRLEDAIGDLRFLRDASEKMETRLTQMYNSRQEHLLSRSKEEEIER